MTLGFLHLSPPSPLPRTRWRRGLAAATVALCACGEDSDRQRPPDAAEARADVGDAALVDAEEPDVALTDAEWREVDGPDDGGSDLSDSGLAQEDGREVGDDAGTAPTPLAAPAVWLTVAEVPREMNGSVDSVEAPLSWRLRVNRAHVSLDVYAEAGSGPIDWPQAALSCDDGGGSRDMGPLEVVNERHARVVVNALTPLADGAAVVCTVSAPLDGEAPDGVAAVATDAFAFDAAELPPGLDPFPSVETWLVTLSRDIFRVTVTPRGDETASVVSEHTPAGDGVRDLDEALFALGLGTPANPEATATIGAQLARRVAALTRSIYELDDPLGPRVAFVFEGEPEAEALLGLSRAELDARRISRIAVGGDGVPEDQAAGTFGRAWIDWNNQTTQDNTRYGVGVFPTALARAALNQPIAALLLGPCRPDLGGVPFGAEPGDASFLGADGVPPDVPEASLERAELYDLLMRFASLGIASILAHEVGHSLGLVPPGPTPEGLFAGVAVDFVAAVTTSAHIDTPGLNVMQTGGAASITEVLSGAEPRFEPLSRAYLRRMLVVGPVIE